MAHGLLSQDIHFHIILYPLFRHAEVSRNSPRGVLFSIFVLANEAACALLINSRPNVSESPMPNQRSFVLAFIILSISLLSIFSIFRPLLFSALFEPPALR